MVQRCIDAFYGTVFLTNRSAAGFDFLHGMGGGLCGSAKNSDLKMARNDRAGLDPAASGKGIEYAEIANTMVALALENVYKWLDIEKARLRRVFVKEQYKTVLFETWD